MESDLKVVYYVPTIPEVYSTDRYQHTLALIEYLEEVHLLSNNSIPDPLAKKASSTTILSDSSVPVLGREAAKKARQYAENGIFLTSPHYEAGLAGFIASQAGLSSPTWIADVYETPAQYRLNNPRSVYQIAARGLAGIMKLAPHGIHSVHPDTPYQYGRTRSFVNNGAPVTRVNPSYDRSDPLNVVWVGSPRLDRGGQLLLEALNQVDTPVKIDIYGRKQDQLVKQIENIPSKHEINHHGWSDHEICLQATGSADIAYCVLPRRSDWLYAPPIKVGEALAGGTVPLVSDFPGSRQLAEEAGEYVNPSANEIASAVDRLAALSDSEYAEKSKAARRRGEKVAWAKIRRQFANKLTDAVS